MKWEIEGELYIQLNSYDQYEVSEPYIITKGMNRDNIIYENREWEFLPITCKSGREDPSKLVTCGQSISNWIEKTTLLEVAEEKSHFEIRKASFQPQTKKVRITIEEIE